MADPCLVFLHIPKTAGLTLNAVLRMQYRRSVTIHAATLGGSPEDIERIPAEQRTRARLVFGHLHYGVHEWIPQPTAYITLLRDPVHRVMSLYGYVMREPRHPLHERVAGTRMGLETFVESGLDRTQVENGQTRQLAPVPGGDPGPDDLARAVDHVRECVALGLTERFDESLWLMRRILGWRAPYYRSRNVTPSEQTRSGPSEGALELIRAKNSLDLQLYDEARSRFAELVVAQGESFRREVDRFRRRNRVVGPIIGEAPVLARRVKDGIASRRPRRH